MEQIKRFFQEKHTVFLSWVRSQQVVVLCSGIALLTASAFIATWYLVGNRAEDITPVVSEQVAPPASTAVYEELLAELTTVKQQYQEQQDVVRLLRADFEAAMKELAATYDSVAAQATALDTALQEVHVYLRQGAPASSNDTAVSSVGKVNINTADLAGLMTLPGIGKTYAERILSYRKEHGLFTRKEDIQEVPGIGSATYTKLMDLIEV